MSKKQYGVTKPKSLDYFLAAIFALVAVSAIWISIWVTATKTYSDGLNALGNFVKALSFNFVGADWLLVFEGFVIYAGIVSALVICVAMLCRKKYKAIPGIVSLLISGVAISICIAFFAEYINVAISGAFLVFLAMFMLAMLFVTYLIVKLEVAMLVKDTKAYEAYKTELGKERIIEKVVYIEKQQPQQEQIKEEPYEYENQNIAKDYFYFENSNGYDNTYQRDFDDYNNQIDEFFAKEREPEKHVADEETPLFERHENNYTFEQKLSISQQIARDYYNELKDYFEKLGFKHALTKAGATFTYKNTKYAMIDVAGQKGLKVYYKLDIKDYEDSPIPVKFKGDVRKYETIPVLLVVKSDLAIKRAKKLMEDVKAKYGIEDPKEEFVELKQEEVKKPANLQPQARHEQAKAEQPKAEQVQDETGVPLFERHENNFTFEQKLERCQPIAKEYYEELKEYFVGLGFNFVMTKAGATFTHKKVKYAMIDVAGQKGLKVYFKLNHKDYEDSPIPVKYKGDVRKYESTPVLLLAKSELAVKRAKKLMEDVKAQIEM